LGVVFYAGLVSLTSSSYPSPCSPLFFGTIVLGKGFFSSASRVLLYSITLVADQKIKQNPGGKPKNSKTLEANQKTTLPRTIVPKKKVEQGEG
jgi:hypothetical protein